MNKVKFMSAVATMCLAGVAQAGLVDFEDVASGTNLVNQSVVSQGFNAAHTGSFAQVFGNSGQGATDFSGNGTHRWLSFNTSSLTLTQVGGAAFSAFGFDGGESWIQPGGTHSWATQIQVVGNYAAGGSTTQTFDLDLIKNTLTGMQAFGLNSSFVGLNSLVFTGIGGNPEFSVDNVAVGAVPEPATYALMLAALGLMGFVARRRRAA